MNFSEYLFQQIQKYHTKPSDILILVFSCIVAFATLYSITQDLNPDKKIFNLLTIEAGIAILSPVPIITFYIGVVISATNNRIHQVERAIILNQSIIDELPKSKKDEVLTLIKKTLHSKSRYFERIEPNFKKLMGILNPPDNAIEQKSKETTPTNTNSNTSYSCKKCFISRLLCQRYIGATQSTKIKD